MSQYRSFHCTARGYSHVKKETVCQDASQSVNEAGFRIAVVSDGHGQKTSFRSDVGSRIAVEAAEEMLRSLADFLKEKEDLIFRPEEQQSLLRRLADKVVRCWNIRIRQHLQENPLTEEEYILAGDLAEQFRQGRNIAHIYGATLIAALLTDRYLLVMHQGDGRCVVIHADGRADQPVPWDARCVGNVCTSLCHTDAAESFRFYVQDLEKERITACYVTTDGIEDCFPDQTGVNAFFCELTSSLIHEGPAIENRLKEILPYMSENGSADDMSLAAVVDLTQAAAVADRLRLTARYRKYCATLRQAREKLCSMERKMEGLKERYRKAMAQTLRTDISPEEKQRLAQAAQDARKAYDDYVERFNSFRDQARSARKNALRILAVMEMLECDSLLDADEAERSYIREKIQKKASLTRKIPISAASGPSGEDWS